MSKEEKKEKTPDVELNKLVRVINNGDKFQFDLTGYGYGMRFPSKAVYSLPMRVYLELLEKGMDGALV